LGIPEKDHQLIFNVAKLFMVFPKAAYTQDAQLLEGIAETATLAKQALNDLITLRRREPRNDLISTLALADYESRALDDEAIVKLCTFLLVAGHETTANLLSGSMRYLLEQRHHWERLLQEPSLLPGAIDELLRYVSPVLWVGRFTTTEIEIGGTKIPQGRGVILGLGAANHDPSAYERAEELDLTRQNVHSFAFGHGIHSCVGAAVTRMEAHIALSSLLHSFPTLELESKQFDYEPVYFVHALKSLRVYVP
jgi:cytochrome P450